MTQDYLILASLQTPASDIARAGRIILADRGEDFLSDHSNRFATAWVGDGETHWHHAAYFSARWKAEKDFLERCATEYRRGEQG